MKKTTMGRCTTRPYHRPFKESFRHRVASMAKARYPALSWALLLLAMTLPASATGLERIAADRPDFVDSGDVVGIGHFQIETSAAIERDNRNGIRTRTYSTPTLLRLGFAETLELRLETDGRLVERRSSSGASQTTAGNGDLSLGIKWHAMKGGDGQPSVGWIAQVDIDSGSVEFRGAGLRPSLRMATEWELPAALSLGMMPGLAWNKDATGERFISGQFGVVLGKSWNDRLRSFVELAASQIAPAHRGGSLANADIGMTYLLTDNVQVDTALSRGLNRNTPNLNWTVGLSVRF